jgi:hypothetical protein
MYLRWPKKALKRGAAWNRDITFREALPPRQEASISAIGLKRQKHPSALNVALATGYGAAGL